jgi:hypothetical protein
MRVLMADKSFVRYVVGGTLLFSAFLAAAYFAIGTFADATALKSGLTPDKVSILVTTGSLVFATVGTIYAIINLNQARRASRERIEKIEIKAEQAPEKAKFAWELASAKLEAYFDRNLSQVYSIFIVAITVMAVGFGFMLWGVTIASRNPEHNTAWIAAVSGIITEFIGVTFMVIYRSTMSQANSFMQVLERINTVGMAVQILDSIPESEIKLKNSTRAELVNLLFKNAQAMKTEVEASGAPTA